MNREVLDDMDFVKKLKTYTNFMPDDMLTEGIDWVERWREWKAGI